MSLFKWSLVQTRETITRKLVFTYLFFLTTTFNFLNFGGRNIVFVTAAVLIALVVLFIWHSQLPNPFKHPLFLLLLYLPSSYLLNTSNGSVTSLFYSLFFLLSFLAIVPVAIRHFTRSDFLGLIKFLLFSFFIVTLIGQLYVLLGFFNPGVGAFEGHGIFGTAFSSDTDTVRYYSLSTEPSYASTIVVLLYYLFQQNSRLLKDNRNKSLLFFITAYMVISFTSGFGYLLFAILLWSNLRNQNPKGAILSFMMLLIFSVMIFIVDVDIYAVERIKNIITKFHFSDWTSIRNIDHSASFRILPFYFYLTHINIFSLDFYLGAGPTVSDHFLNAYLFPHITDGSVSFQGGFLPGFLIDYGILGFILVVIAFLLETKSLFTFGAVVMLMVIVNANLNTQLFWITFTFLTLTNHLPIDESTS